MSLSLTQVPDGAPRPQQREHRGVQQQEVLAARLQNAIDQARRESWQSCFLADQGLAASSSHNDPVGGQLCVSVLKGQSQPAVQYVRIRGAHPAKEPCHPGGVLAERRRLEAAE